MAEFWDARGSKMAGGFEDGRRVRRWQGSSKMVGRFEDGRWLLKRPRRVDVSSG
jgi:hypothetical protein